MTSPRSKEDWKARIAPHLSMSLRTASDQITRTSAVQEWLHNASMEAAEGLRNISGMQGEMQGYMRMMNALEDRFPELLEAVDELTEGCGQVDLHWRPMNPNYSRLYIDFDRSFTVAVFERLDELTPEAARAAVQTVVDALPKGSPFPNRPNTVTGLVAFDGTCVGVQVNEHLGEDRQRRYRDASLLPNSRNDIDNLSLDDAGTHLVQLLAPADDPSPSA